MRTDIELARGVSEALDWESALEEASVRVTVTGGVVRLTGRVHTVSEEATAVATARQVPGVIGVIDDLIVRPRASVTRLKAQLDRVLVRYAMERDAGHIATAIVTRRVRYQAWARSALHH